MSIATDQLLKSLRERVEKLEATVRLLEARMEPPFVPPPKIDRRTRAWKNANSQR